MEPTPIVPGANEVSVDTSGKPSSVRSRRSPMASMSARRSRKYGSSIRPNFAAIASITRRTAPSAAISSLSIRRRVPPTISSSLSIIR